ncbi:HAD family hydrolase [Endozoicomonas sp. GU-1]|uniref:histidinol-phosphatase n=1 Tax=Endozoicomonas sp. GU-1 TaxID=3009078 RepID=UPI0022B2EDA8|nr:HAD family hydrolase [Endozoicomonas sp. GU-1]WBA81128.1 HAD-IB family hydrolase [Endozoicomonas sp. GU-1]WBA88694.1 HAD-IB family hydrolase [Endozoicomonas sp. GU-1]
MTLAIFDLDNTLIAGDSDALWGEFMATNGLVDSERFREGNHRFYKQYQQGVMDIREYLDFCLEPLTQYSLEALATWHGQFMAQVISPILLDKALARIEHHRQRGDYIMIITATNRFVTKPIADQFKVDALLAIDLEISDNRYTGNVTGIPTYQQGKVLRLQEWLNQHPEHSMAGSYFYSDSQNDLPLLKKVDNPVAVDPDPELKSFAEAHGWPVISFR